MTELQHPLGRIPSPPDERDFRLENFVGIGAGDAAGDASKLIDEAITELQKTTVSYKRWAATVYKDPTTTHWWLALSNLAAAKQVLAPSPPPPPPPSGTVVWQDPEPVLDQGNYGTCVGNAQAQWGNTLPVDDKFVETDARAIYREATVLDGADDPTYQVGATVRSGVQAMKNRGRLSTYAQTINLATIKTWLQTKGPLTIGVDWYSDMFDTDTNGYVYPTGYIAGGHSVALIGYHADTDSYEFLNSWGAGWGKNGRFLMKAADFKFLLDSNGEAWTAVELPL